MKNIKLSQAQANVVDALMSNEGSYIYKSQFYNHNRVLAKDPFTHKYGFETQEIMQFTKSTFDVLVKIGAIHQFGENKNIYKLK